MTNLTRDALAQDVAAQRGVRPARLVVAGGICGLAWTAGLRGMMAQVAGAESSVDWGLTFGWLLLPGVIAGSLLGWAEYLRRTGGRRRWRWLALSPLVLAAVLFSHPTDMGGVFTDGIGAGTLAVPLLGMATGYALSGQGPMAARITTWAIALAPIPIWALTAASVGGSRLALDTARGAWVAVYYWSFLAILGFACAIPHRPVIAKSAGGWTGTGGSKAAPFGPSDTRR